MQSKPRDGQVTGGVPRCPSGASSKASPLRCTPWSFPGSPHWACTALWVLPPSPPAALGWSRGSPVPAPRGGVNLCHPMSLECASPQGTSHAGGWVSRGRGKALKSQSPGFQPSSPANSCVAQEAPLSLSTPSFTSSSKEEQRVLPSPVLR